MSLVNVHPVRPVELLSVASEMFPFVKTGGLGDIVGTLPRALLAHGIRTRTLLPGYPTLQAARNEGRCVARFSDLLWHEAAIWENRLHGNDIFILDVPALYDRAGDPYVGPDGNDWPDNDIRFAVLARAAAHIAHGAIEGYCPDLVQAHDWQAGLTAAYLHYDQRPAPPVVQTIHNLSFQGCFPASSLPRLGLPAHALCMEGVEYYGQVGFLKAGLYFAAWITTVSPTYAREIQTPEGGMGLDGLLRARARMLTGILNGIDVDIWNPEHDPDVHFPYRLRDIAGRAANKRALQAEFGLPQDPDAFLLGIVSRLTMQKGIDLLPDVAADLFGDNIQLVVVGSGSLSIQRELSILQRRFPRRFACHIGYSEALGHRMPASVDALLMPSRFEPCGLTQMSACHYGGVPIAARVGGLADTIVDANAAAMAGNSATGFLFSPVDATTLLAAIRRAHTTFRDRQAWAILQRNAVAYDVSWSGKAAQYADLFRMVVARARSREDAGGNVVSLHRADRTAATAARRRIARQPRLRTSRPRPGYQG
ncbi:glycogen synthase GlgA [Gluconacetobacter entanii]|uniref:Glycogen synthase n=1 Tax=Gluconacetobacter entanii TaxID=108528 RepID=A0A318PSY6_9PROT|nr:glycogen synthase GlgA [Gluconacetobacter entanii]PYD61663.1 starch synthase [Gluconacetobacter entanii]